MTAQPIIGIISPGDMGHALGAVLVQHGLRVLTNLQGRSPRTVALARQAGITDVLHGQGLRLAGSIPTLWWPEPAYAAVSDYLAAKHDDGAAVWRLYTTWRWLESLRALRTRSPQAGSQPSASWAKLMPTVLKPLST